MAFGTASSFRWALLRKNFEFYRLFWSREYGYYTHKAARKTTQQTVHTPAAVFRSREPTALVFNPMRVAHGKPSGYTH